MTHWWNRLSQVNKIACDNRLSCKVAIVAFFYFLDVLVIAVDHVEGAVLASPIKLCIHRNGSGSLALLQAPLHSASWDLHLSAFAAFRDGVRPELNAPGALRISPFFLSREQRRRRHRAAAGCHTVTFHQH